MANSGETLTVQQALQYAQQAGFSGQGAATIVAIAGAESSYQAHPQDYINLDPSLLGTPYYGSRDRGILQINNVAHPEVSDACAYDPACAFKAAFSISSGGTNFGQWSTTQTNPQTGQPFYAAYLNQVAAALGGLGNDSVTTPGGGQGTLDIGPSWLDPGNLPVVGGAWNWFSNIPILGTNWWAKQATNATQQALAGGIGEALGAFTEGIWGAIKAAAKPIENFSLRVGLVLLGGILIPIGLFIAFTGTDTGRNVTVTAAKAAAA